MNNANLWPPIFLISTSILLVLSLSQYGRCQSNSFDTRVQINHGALSIAIILSIFVGLRPLDYIFADMMNYYKWYMNSFGASFEFDWEAENLLFDNMWQSMSSNRFPVIYFYLLCDLVFFVCMFFACRKMFPKDYLVAFLVNLTAFITFSSATNGFKSGMAFSIFMLALAYWDNKMISFLFALISCGIHHSMKVVLVAYVVALLFKNLKWYYVLWIFSFFMALFHISYFQTFFAGFTSEHSAGYLLADDPDMTYITGFRLDFIIYSATPIVLGYYLMRVRNIPFNKTYLMLYRLYILLNSLWMLCMYAAFTNRIAALSWFLLPIVLIYPFYSFYWSDTQLLSGKKVSIYHMAFTLFMAFIYYGLK